MKTRATHEILASYNLRDKSTDTYNLDVHAYWHFFFDIPMPRVHCVTYFGDSSWINYDKTKSMLVAAAQKYKEENGL
jgi:hypothetical protein